MLNRHTVRKLVYCSAKAVHNISVDETSASHKEQQRQRKRQQQKYPSGQMQQAALRPWNILPFEQAILASPDRLFESGTSLKVPVQLNFPGFQCYWAAHCISYLSTPAALAVCVAIASISAGDKQS